MAAGHPVATTGAWAVETLLDRLTGDWSFTREIDNGVRVTGGAIFAPADERRLAYAEQGRMRLPDGPELDAHANYLFGLENDRLTIHFAQQPPRLFQAFAMDRSDDGLAGTSLHDCPPDTYRSRIAFHTDGSWGLIHAVCGPRKAYTSVTRYRR